MRRTPTDKLLAKIGDLIRRCDQGLAAAASPVESPRVMFHVKGLGGVMLAGELGTRYHECRDGLEALHGLNPQVAMLSPKAAKELLQETILRAVRPRDRARSRARFERRLKAELRRLRATLTATPPAWHVNVVVSGFVAATLPATVGRIQLRVVTKREAKKIGEWLVDFAPRRRAARERVEFETTYRAKRRVWLAAQCEGKTAATLIVNALDAHAAKAIAFEHVRRALDTINFFAPRFEDRREGFRRAFLTDDGTRSDAFFALKQIDGAWLLAPAEEDWSSGDRVAMIPPHSKRAREIGFARASKLLAVHTPTTFERRILNALSWAGRAMVASRREDQFVLFAIALEAMLSKASARGGVTERLALRAAHLIGLGREGRVYVAERMPQLYALRSRIVHAGDSTDLTDADLQAMQTFCISALTRVLREAPFKTMKTDEQFDQWFDARTLR